MRRLLPCVAVLLLVHVQTIAAQPCSSRANCGDCVESKEGTSDTPCWWCSDLGDGKCMSSEDARTVKCPSSWRGHPSVHNLAAATFMLHCSAVRSALASSPPVGDLSPPASPKGAKGAPVSFRAFGLLAGEAGRTPEFDNKQILKAMQADPMLKKQADKYVDVDFNKWRDAWWTGTPSNDRGLGIDMFAMMMFEQLHGIPEADLTKTPPSDFSAFLKAKQISLLMRGRSFPFKLMLQVLQTLPDSFYALKNHANGQLFQSIVVEHPESGDVATFSVPGESMTEVGNGKASLAIFENARRNHPLFVNVMIHELGHNWERSLRRVKLEVYTELIAKAKLLKEDFLYVFPMPGVSPKRRLQYLFETVNEPLAEMFLFYVAHGQLLRDHITQLKLRDGKSKQYEAFRDIYNQIKADLGIEYCELLTADGASDPARCLPLM